jgi:branched-chain amino acid transport system ATP-binding protein
MLKVRNLNAGYGKIRILKNLSLHVNPGEIVSIIGANGAGKTTLLNTIAGIHAAEEGSLSFKDRDISKLKPEKIAENGCILVPEGRQLFAAMSVEENLIIGGYILRKQKRKSEADEELASLYRLFPRLEERREQLAGTLSGGEQQMLAISRALMSKPDFIMLDEPSMGLAPIIVKDIFAILRQLKQEGKTILLVEQNARAALSLADRGYVMETGRLILEGSSDELLENNDVQRAYLGKDYKRIDE